MIYSSFAKKPIVLFKRKNESDLSGKYGKTISSNAGKRYQLYSSPTYYANACSEWGPNKVDLKTVGRTTNTKKELFLFVFKSKKKKKYPWVFNWRTTEIYILQHHPGKRTNSLVIGLVIFSLLELIESSDWKFIEMSKTDYSCLFWVSAPPGDSTRKILGCSRGEAVSPFPHPMTSHEYGLQKGELTESHDSLGLCHTGVL